MNKDKVKTILGSAIQSDNSLYCCGTYIAWSGKELTLDGDFDLEYLEAVIWWVKNNEKT
jgi:hypothetical protein